MDPIFSFLKYIEYEKRYSQRTIESYRTDLLQFKEFCTYKDVSQIQQIEGNIIREWIVYCVENKLENRSVNRKISTLKSFFKFLLKEGIIQKDPLEKIDSLKTRKRLPVFVTEEQMTRLFDEIPFSNDYKGIRDRFILELLYGTGIRLSELIHIRLNDFNHEGQTLKVLGKRNKERIIPVSAKLVALEQEYITIKDTCFGKADSDWLFLTDTGKALYPKFVYRLVVEILGMVTTLERKVLMYYGILLQHIC